MANPLRKRTTYIPQYSESERALRSGFLNTESALRGAAAAGGRLAGEDEFADEQLAKANEATARASLRRPTVDSYKDIDSVSSAGAYVRNKLLENSPTLATLAVGGGAGGAVGKLVGRAATGAKAGTYGAYTGAATGDNYQTFENDPEMEGSSTEKAGAALVTGAGQAALGLTPLQAFVKRMRVDSARSLGGRALEGTAFGAGAEAGTEGLEQTGQNWMRRQYGSSVPLLEGVDEAAAAGAAVGGSLGLAGGAASGAMPALHTPEGQQEPEALQLFDGAGLGQAARRQAQKAMQSGEDGTQALKRFANENAEVLGTERFAAIRERLDTQGLGGVVPHPRRDDIDEQLLDEDASEEVSRAHSRTVANRLRTADPALASEVDTLEGLGLDDPDVQRRLDELDVQYSRGTGSAPITTVRTVRKYLQDENVDSETVIGELAPTVQQLVNGIEEGQLDPADPELFRGLSEVFTDPYRMLMEVSAQTSDRPFRFEQEEVLDLDEGVRQDDQFDDLLDDIGPGEEGVEYGSINTVGGEREFVTGRQKRPWKKREAVLRDNPKLDPGTVESSSAKRGRELAEQEFSQEVEDIKIAASLLKERGENEMAERLLREVDERLKNQQIYKPVEAKEYFKETEQKVPEKGELFRLKRQGSEARDGQQGFVFEGTGPNQEPVRFWVRGDERTATARAQELMKGVRERGTLPEGADTKDYEVLAREKPPAAVAGGDEVTLQAHQLFRKKNPVLEKVWGDKEVPRGRFRVVVRKDGKEQLYDVNAKQLVKEMQGPLDLKDEGTFADRIGRQFTSGLSALLDRTDMEVEMMPEGIPDDLELYGAKDSEPVHFGDTKVKGAERFKRQGLRLKAQLEKEVADPKKRQLLNKYVDLKKRNKALSKTHRTPESKELANIRKEMGKTKKAIPDAVRFYNEMAGKGYEYTKQQKKELAEALGHKEFELEDFGPEREATGIVENQFTDNLVSREGADTDPRTGYVGGQKPRFEEKQLDKIENTGRSQEAERYAEKKRQEKAKARKKPASESIELNMVDETPAAKPTGKLPKPKQYPGAVDLGTVDDLTPVWAVVEPRDEVETGRVIAAFKSIGKAQALADELGANVENTLVRNLRAEKRAGVDVRYARSVTPSLDAYRQAEKPAQLKRDQRLVDGWLSKLGLDSQVESLTTDSVQKVVDVRNAITNALKLRDPKTGKYGIWVRPDIAGKARKALIGHELGHVVFQQAAHDIPAKTQKALKADFEKWRKQFGETATVGEINAAKKTLAELAEGLDRNSHFTLGELSRADREYLLDFEEWFADNVSRWLTTKAEPKGAVQQFFDYVAGLLRDLFGIVGKDVPAKSVGHFMRSLRQGPVKQVPNELELAFSKSVEDELPADFIKKVTGKNPFGIRGGSRVAKDDEGISILLSMNAQDPYGEAFNVSLRYAFESDLMTPKEKGIIQNAFGQSATKRKLLQLVGEQHPDALAEVKRSPEAAAAYGFQFWQAGAMKLGPQTENIFQRIVDAISKVLGIVREHKQAEQILSAFRSGTLNRRQWGEAEFVVSRQVQDTLLQKATAEARKVGETVAPYARRVLSVDDQLRGTDNPWLTKLADQFHVKVGSSGTEKGMLAARGEKRARFEERLHEIFDGKDKAFGKRMVDIMNGLVAPQTDAELKTLKRLHHLLAEIYDYSKRSHVKLGYAAAEKPTIAKGKLYDGYYTRVWDVDKLQRRNDEFKKMLREKYPDKVKSGEAAQSIYQRLVENYGDTETAADALLNELSEGQEVGAGTPWAASAQERPLGFIKKEDAAPFLSDDLGLTISTYISQQVKRAEYTRRFGRNVPGAMPFETYLEKAAATGASEKDLAMARKGMKGLMGTLGSDISPTLHRAQGALMVVQNYAVLGLSTLTSLTDPLGILVRGGDLGTAWEGWKAGVKEVKAAFGKEGKSELVKLAEGLGTVELHGLQEALGYEYGGYYVTGDAKKWNDRLFRWNGLQGWTRITRLMALQSGQQFLAKHKTKPTKHSERWLDELNLTADDIKLDKDGKLVVLSHAERMKLRDEPDGKAEFERDERIRAALNRFVDESILRPNAAQRPIWASDPHWMLVFHLKAFIYSFHDRILKRVNNELMEGNLKPLLHLQAYIPAMVAIEMLRDGIQGDGDDKDDWGFWDWASHGAERAGLYGLTQFGMDAMKDVEYGNPFGISLAGPSAEHAWTLADDGVLEFVERGTPAQNIWEDWGDQE